MVAEKVGPFAAEIVAAFVERVAETADIELEVGIVVACMAASASVEIVASASGRIAALAVHLGRIAELGAFLKLRPWP